jgi:type IV secretory pathway TraG/TraD family ATPase VirD4
VPNLQHIDYAVNFGRSLGVKFVIGIQNLDQIYEVYSSKNGAGNSRAKAILSGFFTVFSFRVNDNESRSFIQGLSGKNRKMEVYSSSTPGKPNQENIRDGNVIEDWNISSLGLGEAIVSVLGYPPFKFKFNKA